MIDIHSHLIYGVDDGPLSIDQSLRMICEAEEIGIKVIIATPHYRDDDFDNDRMTECLNNLLYKAADYDVVVKAGYEVLINPFIDDAQKYMNMLTLANSRYMLIEFPFDIIPIYSQDTIYRLQLEGITPIIAHPERNNCFLKNPEIFMSLLECGCRMQVDAASILGVHGDKAKQFARKIIKQGMADFVASDAHSAKHYAGWYLKAYYKVIKWAGEEQAEKLFIRNAEDILESDKENFSTALLEGRIKQRQQ